MKLLTDGKMAFPEIIDLITGSKNSIYINMFIWRNDDIGRRLAKEILDAADRGVEVTISKDRYGAVLEYCEECRSSFFHREPTGSELFNSYVLEWFYHLGMTGPKNVPASNDELYSAFINHPRIKTEDRKNKYDHSKYYIFDNKTVVLGGINIEDKELTVDWRGQSYHDYMVKITEPELVSGFIRKTQETSEMDVSVGPNTTFNINRKEPVRHFEMRDSYLKIINESEKSLLMLMAYISTLPDFMKALLDASERGVDISIVIPRAANFQDDLNKKCISRLIRESGGKIKAYLYPNMLHAKLVMSEKTISVGSCNITKKAFKTLDELNIVADNDDSDFAASVKKSVKDSIEESAPFTENVKYSRLRAGLESIIM